MDVGKEDYSGAEVLILGGGDGALIKELVEMEPKPKVLYSHFAKV